MDNVGDKVDFEKLRRDVDRFLEENKQRIHDNPHSIDFVLKKLDNYIDNTFRNEIKELFPLDERLVNEIEGKLTRPRTKEVEIENSSNIKNRLVSISTRLENELKVYERSLRNSLLGEDFDAYQVYVRNVQSIIDEERDFLSYGSWFESLIKEINHESKRVRNGESTKNLKLVYQHIRSNSVIDIFKKREEKKIFSKVDQVIGEYRTYLYEYLTHYQVYYKRYSGVGFTKNNIETDEREGTSGLNFEKDFVNMVAEQDTHENVQEVEHRKISKLDEGLVEVGAVVEEAKHQIDPHNIQSITITYNDGYTITLDIPPNSREKLKEELVKLVF